MGGVSTQPRYKMKVLLAVSALLGLAVATTPCEDCTAIVTALAKYLTSEEFIAGIVEALSGDGFCGQSENPEECANVIAALIPVALPALANAGAADTTTGPMICNSVMEGVCA